MPGTPVTVLDNLTEGHERAVDPRAELIVGDLQKDGDIGEATARGRGTARITGSRRT